MNLLGADNCKEDTGEVVRVFRHAMALEVVFMVAITAIEVAKTNIFEDDTWKVICALYNCQEVIFSLAFSLLHLTPGFTTLMVGTISRVQNKTDNWKDVIFSLAFSLLLMVGTISMVLNKTVGFQRRLTNELQQEDAELQRQCAELRRTKKCLEDSQRKVQQLERRNEELEEIMKHQNEYATELDRYEMGGASRGICLVINNFNFSDEEERQGSKLDEEAIASLFNELYFKVEIKQNLGGLEILQVAQEMAARDHSKYAAFVFCIMSHGDKKDVIYGVDNRKAGMEDLMSEFTATNCPTLENKPKLFFIQACRGEKSDPRMKRLSASTENIAEDGIQTMNSPGADLANGLSAREADFLLAFATVPGYKAWRSKQAGSWFIQEVVDVIRRYHHCHHLLDMLTEVNKRVADIANEYPDVELSFQVPAPTHTLRAQVFL